MKRLIFIIVICFARFASAQTGDSINSDFVFYDDYQLMPLENVEKFIKENRHLPDVPSACEIEENGTDLQEMNNILLRKIEELTLYTIEQQKLIEEMKCEIEILKSK